MIFGLAILATALLLSLTAAYYSVAGLTAIFAAATIPIIVMGGSLELGKIVATVWLHNNWKRIPLLFKAYLIPAIAFLMFLTSMGIFGYLSKAHLDQSLTTGDASAQVYLFDDKIKIEKDNIEAARAQLKQMDATVNLTMDRGTDERSVQTATNLRKRQTKERQEVLATIAASQKNITSLQEQRAPLAMQSRKIEAEVGPIKYIAALMYSDNPDTNLLERAVRWVIILIVLVFDPLALCLILAANLQLDWARHGKAVGFAHNDEEEDEDTPQVVPRHIAMNEPPLPPVDFEPTKVDIVLQDAFPEPEPFFNGEMASGVTRTHDEFGFPIIPDERIPPMPPVQLPADHDTVVSNRLAELNAEINDAIKNYSKPIDFPAEMEALAREAIDTLSGTIEPEHDPVDDWVTNHPKYQVEEVAEDDAEPEEAILVAIPEPEPAPVKMVEVITEHVDPNTRTKTNVHSWVPESIQADNIESHNKSNAGFGTAFPNTANKGDVYVRVDYLPTKLFKFNGVKWIEVDKVATDSYTFNEEYVKYLIEKLNSGEYSIDDLTQTEQDQIAEYLDANK